MPMVDCPHCCVRVFVADEGLCPACRGDTRQAPASGTPLVSLTLSESSPPPACCLDCGAATQRVVTVSRGRQNPSAGVTAESRSLLPAIAIFCGWATSWLWQRQQVRVRIAQCGLCAARGAPAPRYVDFANFRMTFVVHPRAARRASEEAAVR